MRHFIDKLRKHRHLEKLLYSWTNLHTIAVFFGILFLVIIARLFWYTIVEGKYYKELADKQQIWEIRIPVNRGGIFSSVERGEAWVQKGSAFATSINLYNIAIDPQMKWDKEELGNYLVDFVYDELCSRKEICQSKLQAFLQQDDTSDYRYEEGFIKNALKKHIFKKIAQTKVTSVLIDKELTDEQLAALKIKELPGVYPTGSYVYINPEEFEGKNISTLAELMHIKFAKMKFLVRKRDLQYVPILSKISISGGEKLKDFLKDEQAALARGLLKEEESISNFFILKPNPTRYYPEWNIASQIIGFVDKSAKGKYGLEGYFNDMLRGTSGSVRRTKDVYGRVIDSIAFEQENSEQEWTEIITTIDRNIQKKVEEIIKMGVINYRATKWTIVVAEPKTGRILAMANYPTFDTNDFWNVYAMKKVEREKYTNPKIDLLWYPIFVEDRKEGRSVQLNGKELFLREATYDELWDDSLVKYRYKNWFGAWVYQNDAISSIYEPGSIMKSITVAMAVDAWEIRPTDMYQDNGLVKVWEFTIANAAEEQCKWYNTFQHALNFSCNVWMVRIIQKMGKALAHQYFLDFWFTEKTGVELTWEVTGTLYPWEKISRSNSLTRSYGLGVSATPLQMATAYNILANGGIYMKPQIIDRIIHPNWRVDYFKPEARRRVIKESTSKIVSKMLYQGVEIWLAKNWKVEWYSLAGKTGTAQIFERWDYQSGPGETNASYAGYGPVEDPKFTIVVKLSRPKANIYGGQTSAKLFKEVAEYLFSYYGIPKKNTIKK